MLTLKINIKVTAIIFISSPLYIYTPILRYLERFPYIIRILIVKKQEGKKKEGGGVLKIFEII